MGNVMAAKLTIQMGLSFYCDSWDEDQTGGSAGTTFSG